MRKFTDSGEAFQAASSLDAFLHPAGLGYAVLAVRANKHPIYALVPNGVHSATRDPALVEEWLTKVPGAEPAITIDGSFAIVDCDCHGHDEHGPADFEKLAGTSIGAFCAAIGAPYATTPSGNGVHIYFATRGKSYRTGYLPGVAVQLRAAGHYCCAPGFKNGREWLRPLVPVGQLPPVPAFFDSLLELVPVPRVALERMTIAPREVALPSDPWAQRKALIALERACARIASAPRREQGVTLHRQAFFVGGLIDRGDLDYAQAFDALLAAARLMPTHDPSRPWRGLEARIARQLAKGMARPLPVSETELWLRTLRARMAAKCPQAGAAT
jgi:hypothetical protein